MRFTLALRSFGLLLAGTLLVASSQAMPIPMSTGPTDETIISEVANNKRPVLLFSPISKNRFLVVIGGTGDDPLVDAQIFDQPMDNMESDCAYLKSSQPLKTRWPALTGSYQRLFAVPDSTGDNIILLWSYGSSASALNPDTGTVEMLSNLATQDVKNLKLNTPLSSTKSVNFVTIQGTDQPQFVKHYFDNSTLDQAEKIVDNQTNYYICDNGQTSSGQQSISVSQTDCQVPIKWTISTGFVNDTSVVLVNEENAVYIFDRAALTSSQPVDVVKIPAETFWTEWQSHPGWFQRLPPILRLSIIYGSIFAVFLLLLAAWRYMAPIYCRPRQMDANNEDGRSVEMPGTHEEYKALIRAGKKVRRPKYVDDTTFDFACGPRSGEADHNARFTEEDIAQRMDNLGMAKAKQSGKTKKKKKQARPLVASASNSVSPLGAGRSAQMVSMKKAAKRSTKQAPVEGKISMKKDAKRTTAKPAPVSKKQARRLDYSASTSASPIDVGRSAKKIKRSVKQAPVEVSMKKAAKWSTKPAPVSLKAKVSKSKTKRPPKTSSYKTVKSSQSSLVVYIKANRVDTD